MPDSPIKVFIALAPFCQIAIPDLGISITSHAATKLKDDSEKIAYLLRFVADSMEGR